MARYLRANKQHEEKAVLYQKLLEEKDLSVYELSQLTGDSINAVNTMLYYLTLRKPLYEYRLGLFTYFGILTNNSKDIKKEVDEPEKYRW